MKWPDREDDIAPPFSAVVKNSWTHTSTVPYDVIKWCLRKKRSTRIPALWCLITSCWF